MPINIISKSIIYQSNEYYEVKIISQPEIVQYLVIIRINMPCKYAFIRIKDFDDHDGEILLGDICGTKFLWRKFHSFDPKQTNNKKCFKQFI